MTDPVTTPNPQTAKRHKVVALALGVSGLAILLFDSFHSKPFFWDPGVTWGFGWALILIGLVVYGSARYGKTKSIQSFRILVLLALIIGTPWVTIIAPNFSRMPKIAAQGEARSNLDGIYLLEMEFYKEHKRYGTFEEIGFSLVNPTNRYTYRIDASGRPGTMIPAGIGQATPDNTMVPAGLSSDGQSFTATATAHLDNDAFVDQWHVNDLKQGLQTADVNDITNSTAPRDRTLEHAISKANSQPQDVDAQLALGEAYSDRGQHVQAIEVYKTVIRLKPDSSVPYARMGDAYGKLERSEDAAKAFKQAVRIGPPNYDAFINLARASDYLGKYDDAIEAYQQAVNLRHADHMSLGHALLMAQRYQEAVVALKEAVHQQPTSPEVHYDLSIAYYHTGNREGAQKHYKILNALSPPKAEELSKLIVP